MQGASMKSLFVCLHLLSRGVTEQAACHTWGWTRRDRDACDPFPMTLDAQVQIKHDCAMTFAGCAPLSLGEAERSWCLVARRALYDWR